jgi:hypothetical protein
MAAAAVAPEQVQPSRRFDVVVLGATGFVGSLVAEEIATNYQVRVILWIVVSSLN